CSAISSILSALFSAFGLTFGGRCGSALVVSVVELESIANAICYTYFRLAACCPPCSTAFRLCLKEYQSSPPSITTGCSFGNKRRRYWAAPALC
ncbi:unnamed protein product, partial [Ceratitis capitata]